MVRTMRGMGRADLHGVGSNQMRILRKAAVDAYVQDNGQVCPGWQVPAHPSTDLCADHITSVALGGDPRGPFGVLCRSCNARKGKGGHALVSVPAVRSKDWFA
jgi:hypothetical protein